MEFYLYGIVTDQDGDRLMTVAEAEALGLIERGEEVVKCDLDGARKLAKIPSNERWEAANFPERLA